MARTSLARSLGDSLEGHGTHIAGTLAGFPEDGGDDRAAGGYKGMAPAAKIAFVKPKSSS
ncbi:hypothetical protein T484DRAFT_1839395 [Baffinella frigidus]|nr:hypothetical protein T484DRAFT_1839395 [Cryptophyta sp. CCMP2293]